MSLIDCQVDIAKTPMTTENSLTVGQEFYLKCHGDWPQGLKIENMQFQLPEAQKYNLKLLQFQMRDLQTADIKVTSYIVGPQKFDKIILSDGVNNLELTGVQYQVQSVQDPADPKKEPYGPMGPLNLRWPPVYWVILGTLLVLLISTLGISIWKKIKRKKWLENSKKYDVAHTPIFQFHQELRRTLRQYSFFSKGHNLKLKIDEAEKKEAVSALDRLVRVFLVRELKIAALDGSDRQMLLEFKKYHRNVYESEHEYLRHWLKEIKKIHSAQETVSVQDVQQLANESRVLIEKIFDAVQKEKSSVGVS